VTRALLTLVLFAFARCGMAQAHGAVPAGNAETMGTELPAPGSPAPGWFDMTSKLAPVMLHGSAQVPELWLAQRTIDREWGPSEDSTYRTIDVKGWKSEGLAWALSGALPGAGQLYADEGSGWFYLLGEAAGWAGRIVTRNKANKLRDQAAAFVGDPTDSASTWSFARYSRSSGADAAFLEQLWVADRESFYQALATDPAYRAGFSGSNPAAAFDSYRGLRESSQNRLRQSRALEIGLWLNHVVSAFDALRATHIRNLPLRRTMELQMGGRMRRGEPQFRAALVRRF
jgi:hypothetical protein